MRMPRLRFTVRRSMVAIVGLALVLHLTITAWRVHRSGHQHLHSFIVDSATGPGWAIGVRIQPFWPTFWRRSIGWKPQDRTTCLAGTRELMERCELVNPEIRRSLGPIMFVANYTPEQVECFQALRSARYPEPAVGQKPSRVDEFLRLWGLTMLRPLAVCQRANLLLRIVEAIGTNFAARRSDRPGPG